MIKYIEIAGFKSIKNLKRIVMPIGLELRPINILIGSNGSGKSNFVSFFKMINAITNQKFQQFVMEEKADNLLYFGRKNTEILYGKIRLSGGTVNDHAYIFVAKATQEGSLYFAEDTSAYLHPITMNDEWNFRTEKNLYESLVIEQYPDLKQHLNSIKIFHFHDTSA
jgi:predicted ATPase